MITLLKQSSAIACLWMLTLTAAGAEYQITPDTIQLTGNPDQTQFVITVLEDDQIKATSEDVTFAAEYVSSNEDVVTVNPAGLVMPTGNGSTEIQIKVGDWSQVVPVTVEGVVPDPAIDFSYSIQPILSKAGCNMGACHASQHGKGGFMLSVFGYDPTKDHTSIVRDRLQRRVDFLRPDNSLLVLKPTMQVPHGGGQRLQSESAMARTLIQWVKAGAPGPVKDVKSAISIDIYPPRRIATVNEQQQLRIQVEYEDGKIRDVTSLAQYDTLDEGLLSVSESGLVKTLNRGQAGVMVRFQGLARVFMVSIPFNEGIELEHWNSDNLVDEFARKKFVELGIEPSPVCDDATFVRRAFLDAIGGLPTPEETRRFLDSREPDKRTQLIDQLLGLTGDAERDIYNDRFAAYWTLKWSDLIRNSSDNLGEQGMWALHNWIRESFRVNRGFDGFVRDLIQARGSLYMNGPANYYQINKNSSDLTEATTQLFMGIRLECAKCHHHPFESYSQADYYGMAAFFSRVGTKSSEEFGLFGRERVVVVNPTGDVQHPRTRQVVKPTLLKGEVTEHPLDRRIPLATWLASPENPWFAKSVVNRYFSYLMGRGLVEPVDDLRSTNPASNEAMLTAVAHYFEKNNYDLKQLVRLIMTSRTYQLSSDPTELNESAGKYYAFFKAKRMPAEALLDSINTATGTTTKFQKLPPGTRAIELPDSNYPNYFLRTFGKPRRVSVCECERAPDENLTQALHTLNGDTIAKKITDVNSRLGKMLKAETPAEEIITNIFMATLSRPPREEERALCQKVVSEAGDAKEGYEDVLWALINSKQFVYIH